MYDVSGYAFSLLEKENYQNTQTTHKNSAVERSVDAWKKVLSAISFR